MPDVFISYSRADSAIVHRLANHLEAQRIDVWIDTEDVPPGVRWREEVAWAIDTSDVFLLIASKVALASKSVAMEIEHAIERRKLALPWATDVEPTDLPAPLQTFQVITGADEAAVFETLTAGIRQDHAWQRQNTELLRRATAWKDEAVKGPPLNEPELKRARAWLAQAGDVRGRVVSGLHSEYIEKSESARIAFNEERADAIARKVVGEDYPPETALERITEAVRDLASTPAAIRALHHALTRCRLLRLVSTRDLGPAGPSQGIVRAICPGPASATVFASLGEGGVYLFDFANDTVRAVVEDVPAEGISWCPASGLLAMAVSHAPLKLWSPDNGAWDDDFSGHHKQWTHVAWSSDGRHLALGSLPGELAVAAWTDQGAKIVDLIEGLGQIYGLAWHGDRLALAAEADSGVWADGKLQRFGLDKGYCAAWAGDGRLFVGDIVDPGVFDAATGERTPIPGIGTSTRAAAWSADDSRLAIGGGDGCLHVLTDNTETHTFGQHEGTRGRNDVTGVVWLEDEKTLVSSGTDGTLRAWDTTDEVVALGAPPARSGCWLSNDDVALYDADSIRMVNLSSGRETRLALPGASYDVCWNESTGTFLFSVDSTLFRMAVDGTILDRLICQSPVRGIGVGKDGVAVGLTDGLMILDNDWSNPRVEHCWDMNNSVSFAWSASGNRMAASAGGRIFLVDWATREIMMTIEDDYFVYLHVSWSASGRLVVGGRGPRSNDGRCGFKVLDDSQEVLAGRRFGENIDSVEAHQHEDIVLIACDSKVSTWDLQTSERLQEIDGGFAIWSPAGDRVLIPTSPAVWTPHPLTTPALLELAESRGARIRGA